MKVTQVGRFEITVFPAAKLVQITDSIAYQRVILKDSEFIQIYEAVKTPPASEAEPGGQVSPGTIV